MQEAPAQRGVLYDPEKNERAVERRRSSVPTEDRADASPAPPSAASATVRRVLSASVPSRLVAELAKTCGNRRREQIEERFQWAVEMIDAHELHFKFLLSRKASTNDTVIALQLLRKLNVRAAKDNNRIFKLTFLDNSGNYVDNLVKKRA